MVKYKDEFGKIVYPIHEAVRVDTEFAYQNAEGRMVKVPDPYNFLENPDCQETRDWVIG